MSGPWILDAEPCPSGWRLPGAPAAWAWLHGLGLPPGARLGLGLPVDMRTAELIQAAVLGGLCLVPFNHRLDPATLAEQAQRAHLTAVVADPGHPLATACPHHLRLPIAWPPPRDLLPPSGDGASEALVLFTSGTTGPAKAVRLPRRALAHALAASCDHLALGPQEVVYGCLPLDHIAGIGLVLRQLVAGYRLVLSPRFDAHAATADLAAQAITAISLVPTQLHRLLKARGGTPWPDALRLLLVGGGPLDADIATACAALGRTACQTWGLSEACAMVTAQRPGHADAGAGYPLPGMAVRTQDMDGHPLPTGTPGILAIHGPALFLGYDGGGGPDAAGWFATGDRGVVGADGCVHVLGRHDDVIVCGGEKIDPGEVEARLRGHPAVAEALVGALPDREWGQIPAALLVARDRDRVPDPAAFAAWLEEHLPGPWRPRRWRWMDADALPRTALGKPRRTAVAERIAPL